MARHMAGFWVMLVVALYACLGVIQSATLTQSATGVVIWASMAAVSFGIGSWCLYQARRARGPAGAGQHS